MGKGMYIQHVMCVQHVLLKSVVYGVQSRGINPTCCVTLQETNGGGVISYLTSFEQLCVEFARVLPLDNTVTVSNVTGTNQDYLTAYSWSCGLDCGYRGNG